MESLAAILWQDGGELLPERQVLGGQIGLAFQEGPPLAPLLQLLQPGGVRRCQLLAGRGGLLLEGHVLGGQGDWAFRKASEEHKQCLYNVRSLSFLA